MYLEAHRCTAEEEWLERWSCRWRRRKAHCYWVAGWMRESFSQWQGTTLATVVIEVLVNKRKRERELSGGIREAQPHKVVLMERVSLSASLQWRNGRCEKRLLVVVLRSAQLLIEMKSAGSELFSLWPFFFPSYSLAFQSS